MVVTGHPKLDLSVLGYDSATADDALIKQIAGRKTVFWNPHFAVQDPPTWSTFDLFKDDILEAFAKRPDLFFIIRPHPLLFTGLIRNGFWTARDEEAFRARIAELENCTLDEWPDYQMAFALSDAIVTDVGSFLLEFYSTGKPVLMLQNPEGLGVNDDANTMEGLYKATRIDQIEAFLDLMMANEDPKEAERKKAIPRFFYHLDGHAGERIRDHIYDAFMRESVGSPIDAAPELQERPASYHHQLSSMQLEEASAKLNSLLDKIGAVSSALHIGCVDGRLTGIISKHARLVYGIDADPDMIAQARVNAASWGAGGKASFSVEHLDCIHSCGVYGLIVCIDVLSSVQNSYSLLRYIDALIAMMREGAHLIVGDRLAQGQAHKQTVDGRTIFYRNEQQYLMMFKRRGLVLEETIMNGQTDGCSYYMFRKVA